MGAQIIPYGQMAHNILFVLLIKNMDVMGPFLPAFAKIPPAGNPKLPHALISHRLKPGKKGIHLRNPVYHRQDIQNGLGPKPRHRCTADVRNGNQLIPQDLPDLGGFFFIAGWSSGIIGNHPHFYGAHQKCVRIAARGISL